MPRKPVKLKDVSVETNFTALVEAVRLVHEHTNYTPPLDGEGGGVYYF